ncbi:MAG: hypothetical protein WAT46_19170 [Saprospiraceae bacterium]
MIIVHDSNLSAQDRADLAGLEQTETLDNVVAFRECNANKEEFH